LVLCPIELALQALKPASIFPYVVASELSVLQAPEYLERAYAGGSGEPRAHPRRMKAEEGGDALQANRQRREVGRHRRDIVDLFREPAGDLRVIILSSKGVVEDYKPEGLIHDKDQTERN
jgi:hypothetical protein